MNAPTYESVLADVRMLAADMLCLEVDEVTPAAHLERDLGGESIELLELAFRLQKHYGRPFPLQQIAPSAEIATDDAGRLTPQSAERLRERYPFLSAEALAGKPFKELAYELLTIEGLAHFVTATLQAPADQPSSPPLPPGGSESRPPLVSAAGMSH